MAPEQARGRGNLVDARTDIWAVGALLFFLLTGRTVHEAETPNELLIASATQPPRSIREFCVALPESIAGLVDRALEMDRERRWPDARSMQEALVSARSGISEALLGRSVDRAVGTGGLATVPETHTAEPSVVSRKDRGRALATPSAPSTRSGALAWVIGSAVVVTSAAATLLVRTFEAPPRAPETPAAPRAATTNAATPPATAELRATVQEAPPAPAGLEPAKAPTTSAPTLTDERPRKKASNPGGTRPEPVAPAPAEKSAPASAPAPSAAIDILDLRR
jgi:serine/threonine-protein kinase